MAEETELVKLVELDVRLKRMEEMTDYHNKVLIRGNGQPSIVAKVDLVIQYVKDQQDNYKYWSRWLIGGFFANVIGFAFAAVLWFIKILPAIQHIEQIANQAGIK
jgi:hypothetical protein